MIPIDSNIPIKKTFLPSIIGFLSLLPTIAFLLFFNLVLFQGTSQAYENKVVHPYIAKQAFYVWPNDLSHEIYQYLDDPSVGDATCESAVTGNKIMSGAEDEDKYDPLSGACVDPNPSVDETLKSTYDAASKLGYGFFHHFYEVDDPNPNGLQNLIFGHGWHGAYVQAHAYWNLALLNYPGNKGLAYWYIGRIAHLLADASVPAHVHNDSHIPGYLSFDNSDSYESYMTSHYSQWGSLDANTLEPLPTEWDLHDLFYNLAQQTQYFPSDEVNGNSVNLSIDTSGWPMPDNTWRKYDFWLDSYIETTHLETIGSYMMPRAIRYTAALYKFFWNAVHPSAPTLRTVPDGVNPNNVSFKWNPASCDRCGAIEYDLEVHQNNTVVFRLSDHEGRYWDKTTYILPENASLNLNSTYSWAIFPVNEYGVWNLDVGFEGFTTGSNTTNSQPTPSFTVSPSIGNTATVFNVNASGSIDPDSDPIEYGWYWGDSVNFTTWSSSPIATHSYDAPGIYTITLVARDNNGAESYISLSVSVERESVPPEKASNPVPQNSAQHLPIDTVFTWQDGGGATSYEVYLGTNASLTSADFQGNQSSESFNPGHLDYDTTYYWRIDAINAFGLTTGDVWSFTTMPPPPWIDYYYWDYDTDWTEGWSSRNASNEGIYNSDYWIVDPTVDTASKSGIISAPNLTGVHSDVYDTLEVRAAVKNFYVGTFDAHIMINNSWMPPFALSYVSGEQVANSQCIYRGLIPYSGQIQQIRLDFVWGSDAEDDRVYVDYVRFNQRAQTNNTISGYIRNNSGIGIDSVNMVLSNGSGATTTETSGYYRLEVPSGWSGTLNAYKTLYSFTPLYGSFTNVTSAATLNFTAELLDQNATSESFESGDGTVSDGFLISHGFDTYTTIQSAATADAVTNPDYTTILSVGQDQAESGEFYVYRASIPFDTSYLPDDCTIVGATLYLYGYGPDYSDTDFNLEIVKSNQAVETHLETTDFGSFGTVSGGTLNTSIWQGNNGVNAISLNTLGLTWIKKNGVSVLGLRSSRDVNKAEPFQHEFVNIWASKSVSAFKPYLVVYYATNLSGLNSGPWPTLANNIRRTGRSSYEGPETDFKKWEYVPPYSDGYARSPVAIDSDGNILFKTSKWDSSINEYIYFLNCLDRNGNFRWKYNIGYDVYNTGPTVGINGTIYICGRFYNSVVLYAIDKNGHLLWYHLTDIPWNYSNFGVPAIGSDGTIYFGGRSTFFAVNPDGSLKWQYDVDDGLINLHPTIDDNGTIYIGSQINQSGSLYALNVDGSLKRKYNYRGGNLPVIGQEGTIYLNVDYYLWAINQDGTLKWKFGIDGYGPYSTPVIGSDGTLYVCFSDGSMSSSGFLYAINPDGIMKWVVSSAKGKLSIDSEDTVHIGSIQAINSNGTIKWTSHNASGYEHVAIDLNKTIYGVSSEGKIAAIGMPEGKGIIYGKVSDISSGTSIISAALSTTANATQSLSDGYYIFSLDPGIYNVTGSKTDYQTLTLYNIVVASGEAIELNFELSTHGPLNIVTTELSPAEVGMTYNDRVRIGGGTYPYTYSIAYGTLPPGLTIDPDYGNIGGTPTATGAYTFAVAVTDSLSAYAEREFTIDVTQPLEITSTSPLPSATRNSTYFYAIEATGGTTPYTFALTAGSLPTGLYLTASTGNLTGTPTVSGSYDFTIQVTDASARTAEQSFHLEAANPLVITTSRLNDGIVGSAYNQSLSATGGMGNHSWQVYSGYLPAGLSLNGAAGTVSGTPTEATFGTIVLAVRDQDGRVTYKDLSLQVSSPLQVLTAALPNALLDDLFSEAIRTNGGIGPYSFSYTGQLPAGLTLNSNTGIISGTPTLAGYTNVSITVADSTYPTSQAVTQTLGIRVTSMLTVTTSAVLPNAKKGVAISPVILTAGGGPSPYTWQIIGGYMPEGIGLNPTTGELSGTPLDKGDFIFSVQVTDNIGGTATKEFFWHVSDTLNIVTGAIADGAKDISYSFTLEADGGIKPYSWRIVSGTLPSGLSFNTTTGTLYGRPTTRQTYSFTVEVSDSDTPAQTAQKTYIMEVLDDLYIYTRTIPNARIDQAYTATLTAKLGTPPYSWRVESGILPPGLSLSGTPSTASIEGTPTTNGTYVFTIEVSDTDTPVKYATQQYTIDIYGDVLIVSSRLASAVRGQSYSDNILVSGGQEPYIWQIVAGSLPAGLSLNSTSGHIFGTIQMIGSQSSVFTVRVTDTGSPSAFDEKEMEIYVFDSFNSWEYTYGDADNEIGSAVVQASDGGYLVAGMVNNSDIWIFKVDYDGSQIWERTFTGNDYLHPNTFQQTMDGGYILAGDISTGGSASDGIYLLKLNADGTEQWRRTYVGQMYGATAQQTTDGGYIIAGSRYYQSYYDYYLIKTDASGNQQWSNYLGTIAHDIARCVRQTSDGGYVISGYTNNTNNGTDFYIVKTNSSGVLSWDQTLGGSDTDIPSSIEQTTDGGYITVGYTFSYGAGNSDIYAIKIDDQGNHVWSKTYGGSQWDSGNSVQTTADGGYIISGSTHSFGSGSQDAYLIKTDAGGLEIWSKTFGGVGVDSSEMSIETANGCYIVVGTSDSFGAGDRDIYLIRYNPSLYLVADFSAPSTSGPAPLTVNFVDQSTGGVDSWLWNFGDGATSTDSNPEHTYTSSGTYSVSLTISGSGGSSTESKTDYISVMSTDSDGDGLMDAIEQSGCTDWENPDTDADGLLDGHEDSNQNGVVDTGETNPCSDDTDGDGMPDGYEISNSLDPLFDDALDDFDDDGFNNLREYLSGTLPADETDVPNIYCDFEPDGDVDGLDLLVISQEFGRTDCDTLPCSADLDGDGDVDHADLNLFSEDIGRANNTGNSTSSWTKTYGGGYYDAIFSVLQTMDGGYIFAGGTELFQYGKYDVWLFKTDENGNQLWSRTFGGADWDFALSVQETTDGGYVMAGTTSSFGAGNEDVWLIKTDANGNEIWNQTFGGSNYDWACSVEQTSDGGYVVAGSTMSYGAGGDDFWLIKTDASGNQLWEKTFGGTGDDTAREMKQTNDGGFILAGGGLFIKTDASGNVLFSKSSSLGITDIYSLIQNSEGDYVLAGTDGINSRLLKTDQNGDVIWHNSYAGPEYVMTRSMHQASDGGYALAVYAYPDSLIIKTDDSGSELWRNSYRSAGSYLMPNDIEPTSDGGLILVGEVFDNTTHEPISGMVIKTDANGD